MRVACTPGLFAFSRPRVRNLSQLCLGRTILLGISFVVFLSGPVSNTHGGIPETTTTSTTPMSSTTSTTSSTTTSTTTSLGVVNLIGHWRFDESSGTNALNDIGTGDGNAVGEGTVSWNPSPGDGKFGGYVTLDGFSGFLCDNESNFDVIGKEVTIMSWVRTSNLDNWYLPILSKGDDTSYDMELVFGQMHLQMDGAGSTLIGAAPNVIDGDWHHLCAVISPPTNQTYVDGVVYDSGVPMIIISG